MKQVKQVRQLSKQKELIARVYVAYILKLSLHPRQHLKLLSTITILIHADVSCSPVLLDYQVQVIFDASPVTAQRIQLCYGLYIPTVSALRKYVLLVVLQYFISLFVETIFSYQNFLVFYSVKNMDYLMTNLFYVNFALPENMVSCW